MDTFFITLNYWAVLVAGAAYWIIGSLWFSLLTGKVWASELEKHGVKLKEPTKKELRFKLITTFLLTVFIALGVAVVVRACGTAGFGQAILLGQLLGICFSAGTIGIAYTWESRSLKLFLIDAGYPVVGITVCSIILTLWR